MTLSGCKTSEEKAAEYYQSGLDLLTQGDAERAIVQFRNVFDIEGTHYEARRKLAEILAQQGNVQDAYSQYLRLAEQYPDDLPTRIALARMAFDAGRMDEFQRHGTRAIELAPQDPEVQALDLALRYSDVAKGQDDATRNRIADQAQTLAASRPDDTLLLGILLDRAARGNDLDRVGPLIDKLIVLQPDNKLRYQQQLAYLMEKRDMPSVERHLLATIEQFPENDQAKADLIAFYMSQGQTDKAEAYLRQLAGDAPAGDSGARVDLVRFLQMQRGDKAARAELDKILADGGDPLIFGALRAGFDYQAGQRDEAIAATRAILEGVEQPSDKSRAVRVQLARMLVGSGDEDAARTEIGTVLDGNPSQPEALKMKAVWDTRDDDADAAITALRSALDQNAEDAEAMSLMADAYYRAGQPALARDYLAQAAKASGNAPAETMRLAGQLMQEGRYRPAEDALVPALRQAPDNLDLLGLLGEVYVGMPDIPRATGVIRRLREIGGDRADTMAEQLELARLNAEDGQTAALDYLEQLAGDSGTGLAPRLSLIRARLSAGDTEAALTLARELSGEHPDDMRVRITLAMTEIAGGDMATGREVLDRLIADNPQEAAPYLALTRLETLQNEPAAAEKVIDQGLTALPDNPELLWVKAGLLERTGEIGPAIDIYDRLYAQDSDSVVVANNLASLLATWHADDPQKVARASAVARRLKDTAVPAFMDTYGWIQHLNGDSQAALPYLEGAAEALPDDVAVQVHLGLVQQAAGQSDAAKAQLTRALDMEGADQDSSVIRAARDALTGIDAPADTENSAGDAKTEDQASATEAGN